MLPNYKVLNYMIDHLPREEYEAMQSERLRNMVSYVYENTGFYRKKFDEAGIKPEDIKGIEDLHKLPFTTKEELQKDQAANPPFGSYTGSHPSTWVKYFSTSGTTGKPIKRVFSQRDWGYLLDRYKRNSNIHPGEISILTGPMDGFMGPTATLDSFSAQGAIVVAAGLMESRAKLELMMELHPVSVSGTVSNLLYLGELAEKEGIDIPGMGSIKVITCVGEPGGAIPETRSRLLKYWGNVHIHDAYGMTEFFPLAPNCNKSHSLHLANDMVIAETVDPETGEVLPDGTPGELVLTNIIGDTQPLIRYRTRDIVTLDRTVCECGATNVRIRNGVEGRVDDMIWYKGVNVFPSAIEKVLHADNRLGNEYRIILNRDGEKQTMTIETEAAPDTAEADYGRIATEVKAVLKTATKVNCILNILPAGSIPIGKIKTKRVIDNRGLGSAK